jgi:hypothetical protein
MSAAAAAAVELPEEVWVQILQHVDYKQRLSACALVCQKLARAAAAATQSLELDAYKRPQRCDAFLSWTSSYGSSLTRLLLAYSPSPIRQLPCPNLFELTLDFCRVQLLPGIEGPGLLHSCTALTSLILRGPTVLHGADGPAPPSSPGVARVLAQLQHFELEGEVPAGPVLECRADQALGGVMGLYLTSRHASA